MNCKQCQDKIVEALYDELTQDSKAEFEAHIVSCKGCSAQYEKMQDTVNIMNKREGVNLNEIDWELHWKAVHGKINSDLKEIKPAPLKEKFQFHPSQIPSWAYGIAAVLLIVVGIFIGRTVWLSNPNTDKIIVQNPVVSKNDVDSVTTQALVYLSKSKGLLLGVMNANDNGYSEVTFSKQQKISRQLIQRASYLKTALDKPDQQQLKQLIGDLEIILMQLANIEVKPGVPAVEMVKRGVDQKSILFKINVEEIKSAVRESSNDKSENTKL
ncbi:MAG: zf-HC2 domain-containing protein [Ignavibacteriales bacterium]|nr:zf-HC2 domain-containing protein [Ignavibacteriales bacterium]